LSPIGPMPHHGAVTELFSDRRLARSFAFLLGAAFVLGTILLLLVQLDITVAEPIFHEGEEVLVDNILVRFEHDQAAWAQEATASLLFALGFASVAGLGATLPKLLGGSDGATRLWSTAFVIAGVVGVVAQLLYLGVKEVAISTQYCECALRDPQLIARAEALDLVSNAQGWLTDGFVLVFGFGLIVGGRISMSTLALAAGWRTYTLWLGIAAIAFVVLGRLLDALSGPDLDLEVISLALTALVAGVLTPIWAVWTARSLP
jgi:hypothetical protein